MPVTAETSASVASQLAVVTSDPSGVTVEELSTIVEITEQLVHAASSDVQVGGDHTIHTSCLPAEQNHLIRLALIHFRDQRKLNTTWQEILKLIGKYQFPYNGQSILFD